MPLLMVVPPTMHPLPIPSPSTKVMTPFFSSFFSHVSLYRRKMIRWGLFFFLGGGGGVSAQNVSAPYENPRPPVPPHWKNPSYATDTVVKS